MNHPNPFALQNDQDSLSRLAIIISIAFVVFAYLPTLQFDYVTTDQWRVFRYSQEPLAPIEKAKVCTETAWKFYLMTGRPLVWLTECLEHTVVSSISDFFLLRPFVLSVVLLTVLCLGLVLSPLVGGLPAGIVVASAFLMTPGYSFMYVQGATAMMALLSVVFPPHYFFIRNIPPCEAGTKWKCLTFWRIIFPSSPDVSDIHLCYCFANVGGLRT